MSGVRFRTIDELAKGKPEVVGNPKYKHRIGWRPEGRDKFQEDEGVVVYPRRDGDSSQGDYVGHTVRPNGEQVTIPGNQPVKIEPTHRPDTVSRV